MSKIHIVQKANIYGWLNFKNKILNQLNENIE